jgi:RNA polymerase sigma-70 factor (ECF subfamily)
VREDKSSLQTNSDRRDAVTLLDFAQVYEVHFHEVARWVRAMGVNSAEIQDVTQDIFIIVQRKLPQFDGNNLRAFLYRITQRTARDHLRSAWFRNFFRRQAPEHALDDVHYRDAPTDVVLEHKESLRQMESILAKMGEKHRRAFVLFEVEGYSGEEIARLEGVPLQTIWTRLHYARLEFFKRMDNAEPKNGLPPTEPPRGGAG